MHLIDLLPHTTITTVATTISRDPQRSTSMTVAAAHS